MKIQLHAYANTSNQYVPGQEAISPGSMSNTVTFFAGARCCKFQNYFPCILRNRESDECLVQTFPFCFFFFLIADESARSRKTF